MSCVLYGRYTPKWLDLEESTMTNVLDEVVIAENSIMSKIITIIGHARGSCSQS